MEKVQGEFNLTSTEGGILRTLSGRKGTAGAPTQRKEEVPAANQQREEQEPTSEKPS